MVFNYNNIGKNKLTSYDLIKNREKVLNLKILLDM